jgi:hypothetical protein
MLSIISQGSGLLAAVIPECQSGSYCIMLGLAWRGMPTSYKFNSIAIIWISFSYYTGLIHPYMGLPRHLMLDLPVFIDQAARITSLLARLPATMFGMLGMMILLFLYGLKAWVP